MKILLISANRERMPDPVFPLGLAYVAAPLVEHGYDVRGLDLCFQPDPVQSVREAVKQYGPDIVAIGIRNIDNNNMLQSESYLPGVRQFCEVLRTEFDGLTVLGGSAFTLIPHEMLDYLGLEYGIVGEGEWAFLELVKRYENGQEFTGIPGVVTRDGRNNGKPTDTTSTAFLGDGAPERIPDLDELPEPRRDVFNVDDYYERGGQANLQTRRGCPFRCIYCTYPLMEGRKMRTRSPGSVADEMERLSVDRDIRHFYIVDNIFNFPPSQAADICEELIRRDLDVEWTCFGQPFYGNLELFQLMKRAGCSGIDFGIDTAVDDLLRGMGKNFDADKVREITSACNEADLSCCHSLLLGGPGETLETIERTLAAMEATPPTALVIFIGLRIYPNTRLQQIALAEGVISEHTPYIEPVYYLSPELDERCLAVIEDAAERNRRWVIPGLGVNFSQRVQERIRSYGVKGPLWEYLKKIPAS